MHKETVDNNKTHKQTSQQNRFARYRKRKVYMIINLIKQSQMFSLTLPKKIKGQYWVTDTDHMGMPRRLVSIEAVDGEWTVKSNKLVSVLSADNKPVEKVMLKPMSFLNLKLADSDERVILFSESIDEGRHTFTKIVVNSNDTFTIGRTGDNNFCFANGFVSGTHAVLTYDGVWHICDQGSTNGTYVNGYKTESADLNAGDHIYIMGLRMIVGNRFIAVNNPDGMLKITSNNLFGYQAQVVDTSVQSIELPEKEYFFRSPRFHREIQHDEIKIDPPPQVQKQETVPMALMLGPSLTMGMTSMGTGILSVTNVMANGGEITQALPTVIMSVSMLLGTVLWPILTKKYEKKQKLKNEKKRQEKYLGYLDAVRDEIKRKCKEQSDILNENFVSPEVCADIINNRSNQLWERVIGQSDFMTLRLGLGELPLDADVKYPEKRFTMDDDNLQDAMLSLGDEPKALHGVPISISFVDNTAVGIYGAGFLRNNLLKSIVLQTVALHSYDEVKIMLLAEELDEWGFVKPIPHFWNDDRTVRFLAASADEAKELSMYMEKNIASREDSSNSEYSKNTPYYIIISASKQLSEKCDAIRQLLKYKNNAGFSILFAAEELKDLPKETKTVIHADGDNSRIFDRDDTTGKGISFSADRINESALAGLSEGISNIDLDVGSQRYILPSMITFLEMFNVGKIEHLNCLTRWKENNPTITLQTPIGVDAYGGAFVLDLHEKFHGPHGLVAGMTGSGKSEFIITYILSLAVNYHPDEVSFILIDYKGGGLTGAFEDPDRDIKLPHLAGTITNLDGAAVKRSLISIQSELRRRQAIFNHARKVSNEGTMDIYKYQQLYRDKIVTEPLPHLFIISDEFAELKTQQPEFMEQLISTARIGRSLGVHLILATQKPNGVVSDEIWSNSKFRVCLKVQEKADSQDMIKCPDAAELSQTGRFYLQVGFNELFALGQSAWCGAEYIPTEAVEKSVDSSIQVVDNLGRVLMNVKPGKKKVSSGNKTKQIVAIVKYLSDLAMEEKITVRPLWLDPIPARIFVEDLEGKYASLSSGNVLDPVVGEYDDPFNQKQGVLTVPFSEEGNCIVFGATGNGKTTFLTTLAYSLIKNHTADELNMYIMDFGSETLKIFEKAPQVGGVMVSADEEKIINFLKMIYREIEKRKNMFSEFGGDYASYCKNSGKTVPNIVILLNNYAGFAEQFEDLQDSFSLLTRDGVKYGIYFAVTATATNAVRYKTLQNFKRVLTMQLNDATEYSVAVGKTEGLIPSKHKGRGLVALEKVYEFQTAYCTDREDIQEYVRSYCKELEKNATSYAKPVPVIPDVVDYDCVKAEMCGLSKVPVGIGKKNLNTVTVNLSGKVIYPVASQDILDTVAFTEELINVICHVCPVYVFDMEKVIGSASSDECTVFTESYEEQVLNLFEETVKRHNDYVDASRDVSVLEKYGERVYVIIGFKKLMDILSEDGKDKLTTLIEKTEPIYRMHYVFADSLSQFNGYNYDAWFKKHISGVDGMWIGDGVADQYLIKAGKITSELYEEIGTEYGYSITRGKATLAKLLNARADEEAEKNG